MSIGMLLDAVKERVRSVSRAERDIASEGLGREHGEESVERRDPSTKRGRTRDKTTLERVTEVLGLESEEEDDSGEGWKEFRKGL